MIALLFVCLLLIVFAFAIYKFSIRKKRKSNFKKGDYVMLRGRYKNNFPGVPTSHALVIEQLQHGEATVVFMNVNNQILKQIIPLYALAKAS